MHALTFACYVGVFSTAMLAYTYATVGGQYSVNVHFVPPLVTASCQIAQFWSPPNVTCALCFCMTGSLSRCIPQPGCRPNTQNSTTPSPGGGNSTASANMTSTTAPENENSSQKPESAPSPSTPKPEGDTPTDTPSTSETTTTAESIPGKVRAAKPGKTRRRRHSYSGHQSRSAKYLR